MLPLFRMGTIVSRKWEEIVHAGNTTYTAESNIQNQDKETWLARITRLTKLNELRYTIWL